MLWPGEKLDQRYHPAPSGTRDKSIHILMLTHVLPLSWQHTRLLALQVASPHGKPTRQQLTNDCFCKLMLRLTSSVIIYCVICCCYY